MLLSLRPQPVLQPHWRSCFWNFRRLFTPPAFAHGRMPSLCHLLFQDLWSPTSPGFCSVEGWSDGSPILHCSRALAGRGCLIDYCLPSTYHVPSREQLPLNSEWMPLSKPIFIFSDSSLDRLQEVVAGFPAPNSHHPIQPGHDHSTVLPK